MSRSKRIKRATLAKYAGLLGRDSLAACALRFYDDLKQDGTLVTIHMRNSGFTIKTASGSFHYG